MARYIGPTSKKARAFGEPIFGYDKAFERKKFPPGQHGLMRKKMGSRSEYSSQLKEKQKAKYIYGMLEKQFYNFFVKASSKKGNTGEILLQLCESRLDNVVFRLGLSSTRRGARQLVNHGHILVNNKKANIPSIILKGGDKISLREKSKNLEIVSKSLSENLSKSSRYDWLQWNNDNKEGSYIKIPERIQIPENINEQLIVELYSK